MPKILIIVPSYNALEYAALAIESALTKTKSLEPTVLHVNDGYVLGLNRSEPYNKLILPLLQKHEDRIVEILEPANFGLTAAWNRGLRIARESAFDYVCCTNDDVVFSEHWDMRIEGTLDTYPLIGPLTNAPGDQPTQDVQRYLPAYKLSDKSDDIDGVASRLRKMYPGKLIDNAVNGFCMIAETKTWWAGAFDNADVFNPAHRMEYQEYELQRRWRKLGRKSAVMLDSFVFHYRSVTRGDKYKRGKWARLKTET